MSSYGMNIFGWLIYWARKGQIKRKKKKKSKKNYDEDGIRVLLNKRARIKRVQIIRAQIIRAQIKRVQIKRVINKKSAIKFFINNLTFTFLIIK